MYVGAGVRSDFLSEPFLTDYDGGSTVPLNCLLNGGVP